MAEEIQLFKADGQEWGFRVTGGADFGTALTVIKINKGSVSERAGLHVGDMIIQVNDQPLGHMTHFQATSAITQAGNTCKATVIRGSVVQVPQIPVPVPQIVLENETENAPPTTGATGEQEELVLPSLLANLINTGMQEQPGDEDSALCQQNQEADQEVADSWNLSLPQHLVVTLKSVTPTQLDGRSCSPWEIIEERSTFSEKAEAGATTGVHKPVAGLLAGGGATAAEATAAEATAVRATAAEATAVEATAVGATAVGATAAEATAAEATAAGATAVGATAVGATAVEATKAQGEGEETKEHIEYTDDEIAEMMSGCAEVLAGKCIGVDFQKLPPDTDIMKSEVLHVLIEEKIHKPEKKLTTFQQRPARPKPRPKGEPEFPPAPYLPLKYKGTPKKKEEEPTVEVSADLSEVTEATVGSEEGVGGCQEPTEGAEGEQPAEHEETGEDTTGHENADEVEIQEQPTESQDPTVVDPSDIESQLAEIQTQLAAIIQLPVEIQQHLTFIQTQLTKILEVRAAETTENPECAEEPIVEDEEHLGDETGAEHEREGQTEEELAAEAEERVGGEEEGEAEQHVTEQEPEPEPEPQPEPEPEPPKCKKNIQWKKDEEERQCHKPFFPLTPQPRPVQLPGGRHWFKPRDVYTEDFIAETISGKEEIITGTTIGVDFRKFQSSLDHLKNSSVYKLVHSNEDKPLPGAFASRAEKVRAKEDTISPCKPTETTSLHV